MSGQSSFLQFGNESGEGPLAGPDGDVPSAGQRGTAGRRAAPPRRVPSPTRRLSSGLLVAL